MADYKKLVPFVLSKEGGFVNNKADKGGATNKGVTIATFRSVYGQSKTVNDLKNITDEQWDYIFKKYYWDKCKATDLKDQSVANMLVDYAVHSGVSKAVKALQRIVGVAVDGIAGSKTVAAANGYARGQRQLFATLKARRMAHLEGIVRANSSQAQFLNGWRNRVNAIGYGSLTYGGKVHEV